MKELTLVTCSYNTPEITLTMLRSFAFHNKIDKINTVIMENSTDNATVSLLTYNNIPFIRNTGGTHSTSVDFALKQVKTKYALLVDTDIIFHKPITYVYDLFKKSGATTIGKIMGDRGGYKLYPRVFPWFQFINIDDVNKHGIRFHNQEKIDNSNSNAFFTNIPLQFSRDGKYYDVGSTFLEDIISNKLKACNIDVEENIFTHYEGMSWHGNSNIPFFQNLIKTKMDKLNYLISRYSKVDIKDKFI